jgi:dephospho-CoA kinase
MSNKPTLIGITGGIGSGKSLVCHIFEILGIPVYYADDRAKTLVHEDAALKQAIIQAFGAESFTGDQYNKAFMASMVFSEPEKLQQLNRLIHPAVARDFEHWVHVQGNDAPYLAKEAALLLEGNNRQGLDQIFVVVASESLRISRVLERDPQRTAVQIKAIMALQLSQDEMRSQADGVIDNEGMCLLIPQVLSIHQSLA